MTEVTKELEAMIRLAAAERGLSPALVAAICAQESSLDPDAMRHEANYRWLWKVGENAARLKITFRTEEQLQSFSYGIMQIMGSTARSCGFSEPLQKLSEPRKSLFYGCKYLFSLFERFDRDEPKTAAKWSDVAVAAYNAGSPRRIGPKRFVNENYVRSVEKFYQEFRGKGWE